jgi:hypothetical protein
VIGIVERSFSGDRNGRGIGEQRAKLIGQLHWYN